MREFKTRVYIADVSPLKDEVFFGKMYRSASAQRRSKIDRLRRAEDKRLSLGVWLLLTHALRRLGINDIEIEYGECGKPYLKDSDVFFNLSHTGERAMCAVAAREVGCDAEMMDKADFRIANRFFSPSECAYLDSVTDAEKKNTDFYRLWTLKESYIKAVGSGIQMGLETFSVNLGGDAPALAHDKRNGSYYFREFDLGDGCRYAVCSMYPEFEDKAETVDLKGLYV